MAHRFVAGVSKGESAIVLHGSGAPITNLDSTAIFGDYSLLDFAYAINDSGTAVGSVNAGPVLERPVRWDSSGVATELGVLETRGDDGVHSWGQAFAINNGGTVVGYTDRWDSNWYDRAVRWDAGSTVPIELGELPQSPLPLGTYRESRAYALNESNTAVGWAEKVGVKRPVRWDGSGTAATELGLPGPSNKEQEGEVYDINENGTAIGWTELCDNNTGPCLIRVAVRWNADGTAATLLESPGRLSSAFAINDAGTAVGATVFHSTPVRWDAGGTAATVLGGLGDFTTGRAYDINNDGVAVGYVGGDLGNLVDRRAVAWRNDAIAVDLNTLIDPSTGWTLTQADSISDTGWITGVGQFDPDGPGGFEPYERLFVLRFPAVPEPATFSLLAFATLVTVAARPQRRI